MTACSSFVLALPIASVMGQQNLCVAPQRGHKFASSRLQLEKGACISSTFAALPFADALCGCIALCKRWRRSVGACAASESSRTEKVCQMHASMSEHHPSLSQLKIDAIEQKEEHRMDAQVGRALSRERKRHRRHHLRAQRHYLDAILPADSG